MSTPKWLAEYDRLASAARTIMIQKRQMRGPSNVTEQGLYGVVNRLVLDKGTRILRAAEVAAVIDAAEKLGYHLDDGEGSPVVDPRLETEGETLVDDLLDTVNYALIALLLVNGSWGDE